MIQVPQVNLRATMREPSDELIAILSSIAIDKKVEYDDKKDSVGGRTDETG